MKKTKPVVAVIMGSKSDWRILKDASKTLKKYKIAHEIQIVSAHRTPQHMMEFALNAQNRGLRVIIAGAGGAAHLPGMVASLTPLPVIGVPITVGRLEGVDAVLSILQMPKGVPVATVAVDNAENAALLAIRILESAKPRQTSQIMTAQKNRVLQMNKKFRKTVI
jgi:phosphoribosylaminoimidazole carboxylase PurE protein